MKSRIDRRRKPLQASNPKNLLWDYTGFLVRRIWQIHVAMFMEETKSHNITPVQFSVLLIARSKSGCDQGSLAGEIGIDRSNAADILARLERRGLIIRSRGKIDRRVTIIRLSDKGRKLVKELEHRIRRSHARLVEDISPAERVQFKSMLKRIVSAKNDLGRAPLRLLG